MWANKKDKEHKEKEMHEAKARGREADRIVGEMPAALKRKKLLAKKVK